MPYGPTEVHSRRSYFRYMGVTRGAVLDAPRAAVRIGEIPLGEPREGEALVRLEACGICHSDLYVAGLEKLPLAPVVLGHEGIGRVEALGPSTTGPAPGSRVGVTFLAATCGACALCRTGRERFCARQVNTGYTTNGVLAGYAVLPVAHLVLVPERWRRRRPRPCAAPGGPPTARCAKRGCARANRWPYSGWAGWATSRFNTRSIAS